MRSLNTRITVSAAIVLAIFVALSAFALEKAFRDSARNAREERLLAQIYLLMAAAEVDADGTLHVANRPAEPRLDLPDSGLYAYIVDGQGVTLWQSRSGLARELPPIRKLSTGEQSFAQSTHDEQRYLIKGYGINWTTDNGSYPFTFTVVEDSSAFDEQLNIYRRSLWAWLSAMAAFLLVLQWATLRWGLAPLRHVSNELNRLEAGEQHSLNGRYPSEVQRLTDNLNTVLSHERKQQQRYRNALSDLAHSLKTPLALVRGTARNVELPDAQSIEQQVDQMDRIIGYHLQRAAASGRSTLNAPIEVGPIVQRIATALKKVYSDKAIQVVVDIDSNMRFRGDEDDLTEILGNLMDNACKWCRSTVQISTRRDQERLRISVEDDGPGIKDTDAERVFIRGARADEQLPGHGIGLAVVREIVEAYGGEARIDRSVLGGTLVELYLPGAP